MTQRAIAITEADQDQFNQLADLLSAASKFVRAVSTGKKLDADFWSEWDAYQEAFSDLTENEIMALANDAVDAVRAERRIIAASRS